MRVLLFGKDGQLGRALAASAPPKTMLNASGRDDADIRDVDALAADARTAPIGDTRRRTAKRGD